MNKLEKTLEVAVEVSDVIPNDNELEADMKELLDMKEVNISLARKLKNVGLHLKGQGILETQRGALYVTQSWILAMCRDLYRMAQAKTVSKDGTGKDVSSDEVCKIADCLGKLAGKQAELSAVLLGQEPVAAGSYQPPAAATPSFPAGITVLGGNAQAHFHQASEKTVAKPPIEA